MGIYDEIDKRITVRLILQAILHKEASDSQAMTAIVIFPGRYPMECKLRISCLVITGIKGRGTKNRMALTEFDQMLCIFE